MKKYHVLGIMSGTSLDGLDLALCCFEKQDNRWIYKVRYSETVPYPETMKQRLADAINSSARALTQLDIELGRFIASAVNIFLTGKEHRPNWIASHGHTVFHQPTEGITLQIGHGAIIAAMTQIPVICDFRVMDVALGGQGAPLVPIGDVLLFSDYPICLNLGGFSNISFNNNGKRIAFDISPCNLPLNRLARELNLEFDIDGTIAASGNVDISLLEQLNRLDFYQQSPPKSLGLEWLQNHFFPLLDHCSLSLKDRMCTVTEHIAVQLAHVMQPLEGEKVLVTGGGAKNRYLIERLKNHTTKTIKIPDMQTVDYKEAIIFAFLGLLKSLGEINTLASVTGASKDSSGGVIHNHC
jgi:anhydro-N-acetylmuramic acid kinase